MKDKKLADFLSFNTACGLRNLAVEIKEKTMATRTNNNRTYYINPAYLTFNEDSGYGANLIQVSASSSCWISVYDPANGITYSDADRNYRRWKITAYNNKFPDNDAFYIYVRLERNGSSALIVYSKNLYEVNGSSDSTEESLEYYYILIGEVSGTNGISIREILYDTGYLESDQGYEDSIGPNEMWELEKYSTPWLIKAKHWLSSFTVKGFISLVGGFIFKKNDEEKVVTDLKRSVDSDDDVPISDSTIPSTLHTKEFVENEIEKLDERFLSKVKPDETPYHIKLLGGVTTTEAASNDYAKDVKKAGWAVKKNDKDEWYVESDELVARILARVYDLMVQNHAVFKNGLSSENFISGFVGGKGWSVRMEEWINAAGVNERKSVAEFDDLIVRSSLRVYEFLVSQMLGENDNRVYTGMMEVDHVDEDECKIYLKTNGGKLYNPFRVDDVLMVQQYGGSPSDSNGSYVTKQYELIVTSVGIGEPDENQDRLDWLTFRDFTTTMEGGSLSLIEERDTLVRIDNLSDSGRKGMNKKQLAGVT